MWQGRLGRSSSQAAVLRKGSCGVQARGGGGGGWGWGLEAGASPLPSVAAPHPHQATSLELPPGLLV